MTTKSKIALFALFAALAFILACRPASASADISLFTFARDITIPAGTPGGYVSLPIGDNILDKSAPGGAGVRILENGKEIPYLSIMSGGEQNYAAAAVSVKASSTRPPYRGANYGVARLFDGKDGGGEGSYYQSDVSRDPRRTTVSFDFGAPVLTSYAVVTFPFEQHSCLWATVKGSVDGVSWTVLKSNFACPSYGAAIRYAPMSARFLQFTFEHEGSVAIGEMKIMGPATLAAVFKAKKGAQYSLVYGNSSAAPPQYDTSKIATWKNMPIAALGKEKQNPLFRNDPDGDAVIRTDNCPLTYNKDQKDSDGDGVGDPCDNCPGVENGGQSDIDNDGVGDVCDNCQYEPNPDQKAIGGSSTGYVCADEDNDGTINGKDNCPYVYNPDQRDLDQNGVGDICEDPDRDGVPARNDNCLHTPNIDQKDADEDGIGDACDNCLLGYNPEQEDKDNDGAGDACGDTDKDRAPDYKDNCGKIPNPGQKDTDRDSVGDACDNCPALRNPLQGDRDNNGIGDICEDEDRDGLLDTRDNCPGIPNKGQKDRNNDGIGDACEDWDNDYVPNARDNCPNAANPEVMLFGKEVQPDKDGDRAGDACDPVDNRPAQKKAFIWIALIAGAAVVTLLALLLAKRPQDSEGAAKQQ